MIRILAIIVVLGTLASCKKCADCTTTIYQNGTKMGESTQEMCGDDLKEADGSEITSTASYQGYTVTQIARTECD